VVGDLAVLDPHRIDGVERDHPGRPARCRETFPGGVVVGSVPDGMSRLVSALLIARAIAPPIAASANHDAM